MDNKLFIDREQIIDVKNIVEGVYSPLTGFLKKEDFLGVVSKMRLKNNQIWPIPIVLDINQSEARILKGRKDVVLINGNNESIAVLEDIEVYKYDKDFLTFNVFQTLDKNHPGVKEVYQMGEYLIGGKVKLITDSFFPKHSLFSKYSFTPQETKEVFKKRGWKTIVAFQTRNIPHRSHEVLQKKALQQVDGLFIQPVIGKKKQGDFKDEAIIKSYEILIKEYYPKERVYLGVLPLKMRYAGPREAILHALIRRNFGCSHIIIGRDHAGVGNYYRPDEAQNIFDRFLPKEIGINILKYDNIIYCRFCRGFIDQSSCFHSEKDKIFLSGTKIRELIENKQSLPREFVRPKIANFLLNYSNPFNEK